MTVHRMRMLSTSSRLLLYPLVEAAATVFASPFLLYLLCSSTADDDIFHRTSCACVHADMYVRVYIRPSTVILTKIRQRLAIVRVSVPASAYCVAIFFLPDTHRPRQDANVRASRFLCSDPGHRIRYGHGWLAIDERRLQKNAVAGAPEVPSPRDSVEQERTTGEVNFCFPALFSDYAEWSGVGLCTPECSYSRKSGLSEVVGGPCLRASYSREAPRCTERKVLYSNATVQ